LATFNVKKKFNSDSMTVAQSWWETTLWCFN